jgi:hypothetical protein
MIIKFNMVLAAFILFLLLLLLMFRLIWLKIPVFIYPPPLEITSTASQLFTCLV